MRNLINEDFGLDFQDDKDMERLYYREKMILDVTEIISKLMDERHVNKKNLAELLGKSKGYVTRLLNGTANMTLKTISDVLLVLNCELSIQALPLGSHGITDKDTVNDYEAVNVDKFEEPIWLWTEYADKYDLVKNMRPAA